MLYGYLMLMLMYTIPTIPLILVCDVSWLYTYCIHDLSSRLFAWKKGPFAPFHPDKVLCFL